MVRSATVTWWSSANARTRLRAWVGADAEVVHPAGAAEGHLAFGVEPVVAEAVVAGRVAVAGWGGFRSRAVGLAPAFVG